MQYRDEYYLVALHRIDDPGIQLLWSRLLAPAPMPGPWLLRLCLLESRSSSVGSTAQGEGGGGLVVSGWLGPEVRGLVGYTHTCFRVLSGVADCGPNVCHQAAKNFRSSPEFSSKSSIDRGRCLASPRMGVGEWVDLREGLVLT